MTCCLCGVDAFDESDYTYNNKLDIFVCDKCCDIINETHGITGKYTVTRCSECGKIKDIEFHKYKSRGRPKGSKNKLKIKGLPLTNFITGLVDSK